MNRALVTSILLTFVLGASAAERGMKVLEDGHELTADTVTLPAQPGGQLTAKGCAECPSLSFSLDASTHFFIGKDEVSLAELRSHIAARPSSSVLVVTPKSQKVVLRIVAQAVDSR